jgi:hypothetical protein
LGRTKYAVTDSGEELAVPISRAFVAMDGDNEPHGWVYASLAMGIANSWAIVVNIC